MSSHKDKKSNNHFLLWLNLKYGAFGEVKTTRGKLHNYLGLIFDFHTKGKVRIDMHKYMHKMVANFEKKYVLTDRTTLPRANNLF